MSTAIVYYSMLGNSEMIAEKAFDRIKKMIGIEKFAGEMIFIDPKTRDNADNDIKIDSFCENIVG